MSVPLLIDMSDNYIYIYQRGMINCYISSIKFIL